MLPFVEEEEEEADEAKHLPPLPVPLPLLLVLLGLAVVLLGDAVGRCEGGGGGGPQSSLSLLCAEVRFVTSFTVVPPPYLSVTTGMVSH